jgi:hypothetical protein
MELLMKHTQLRFQRAIFNRDSSIYGLVNFGINDDDIILTSDADEIINPLVLEDLNGLIHQTIMFVFKELFTIS